MPQFTECRSYTLLTNLTNVAASFSASAAIQIVHPLPSHSQQAQSLPPISSKKSADEANFFLMLALTNLACFSGGGAGGGAGLTCFLGFRVGAFLSPITLCCNALDTFDFTTMRLCE